ncbi:uncharacterized protein K444DRAFT_668614 [Hyaloscypha bicolor E]|uniref:Mid2 domain-containing protein n=1 Tax=Hyaloscypha bicolor E TaxID=1095630 RepID=A0A2J6SQI1_9HELO|nr:uncharacterized protein K444DRAFT_668614 [Hyaloscypha bicolor E]PMD53035.1 hypothetical protein K444DRAFT_668614 [Hyaloscypha bicolor E]
MTPLILILIHCLVAVDGAAYPAPTPAARLEERQVFGISTVWSPTVVGTTVSSLGLTGFACFGVTDHNPMTFFQVSPTIVPSSTTISVTTGTPNPTSSSLSPITTTGSQSQTSTPPPTPPKPPVGAIVGGVVGGLAVLVIGLAAVLLFLHRRSHPAPTNVSTAEVVQQQHPPQEPSPAVPYNPKHASYSSGSPTTSNFPLPMHQSTPGQNEVSYPPPSESPTFSNPVELSTYTPVMHGVGDGNTHQVQR